MGDFIMDGNGITLTKDVQNTIQEYSGDTLTALTQMDNVSELFHSDAYKKATNQLSVYLADSVKKKKSAEFHNSLNFFEKNGFIKKSKQEAYELSMNSAGKKTALAVSAASMAIPYLIDGINAKINKLNFENFFYGWIGYINSDSEISPLIVRNTQSILSAGNIIKTYDQVASSIKLSQTVNSALPHLNWKNLTSIDNSGKENLQSIAKLVVSTADLEKEKVKNRSMEFLVDLFGISFNEAESKLSDVISAQEHLTKFLSFSAFDYMTFFSDFISTVPEAVKIGSYDVEMDIYAKKRAENKKKVIAAGKELAEIAVKAGISALTGSEAVALLPDSKPAKDIVLLSENLMSDTLNPKMDSDTGWDILKMIAKQRKEFDIS